MSFGVAMKAVRSLGKLHTIFRQMWYTWGFATSCFGGQLGLCTSAAGLGGDSQEFQSLVPAIEGQNSWTKAGRCSEVVGVSVNDGAPTGCLKWVRFCSYLRLLSGIDLIWISDYKWRSAGVWNLSWHCQKIASQYRANGQAVFIISLGPAVLFWVYFNKPLGQLDVEFCCCQLTTVAVLTMLRHLHSALGFDLGGCMKWKLPRPELLWVSLGEYCYGSSCETSSCEPLTLHHLKCQYEFQRGKHESRREETWRTTYDVTDPFVHRSRRVL